MRHISDNQRKKGHEISQLIQIHLQALLKWRKLIKISYVLETYTSRSPR